MKIQDINGNERNETRQEILARHAEMRKHHAEMMDLLESIHREEPYFQQIAQDNKLADRAEREEKADNGLTTEINRSVSLVNISDTMENIVALLKRHPFGYKQGSRDRKGKVVNEPFTAAENLAAEKWLASLNNGSPVVADEEAE